MRNPNRLDTIYKELCEIHKKSFSDMRFCQFMLNALGWINHEKRDPFFVEDNCELLNYFKEYANSNSLWYRGWEVLKKDENN